MRPARTGWAEFAERVETLAVGECAYGREILVAGTIGAFALEGAVDFVLVDWVDGRPRPHLIEGKSSRKDRTYHRIQLVCYWLLLRQELEARPLAIAGESIDSDAVKLAVARIEEDTGRPQELLALEALGDVRRERDDIERLLAADGRLAAIVGTDIDLLAFQLSGKCDGCVFNVDCLTESGRQRRLELLGIEPSVVEALHEAGIADIDALAQLDSTVRPLAHFIGDLGSRRASRGCAPAPGHAARPCHAARRTRTTSRCATSPGAGKVSFLSTCTMTSHLFASTWRSTTTTPRTAWAL